MLQPRPDAANFFFLKDFANSECQILEGVGFLIIFFRSRISPKALESSLVSLQSDSLNNNLALREKGAPLRCPWPRPTSDLQFPGGSFLGLAELDKALLAREPQAQRTSSAILWESSRST